MNFKPILFSTEMVKAILSGSKVQTRRTRNLEIINELPEEYEFIRMQDYNDGTYRAIFHDGNNLCSVVFPYGQVGDVLWVREKWKVGAWRNDGRIAVDYFASPEIVFTPWIRPLEEVFDKLRKQSHKECMNSQTLTGDDGRFIWEPGKSPCKWRPSIFMPKEACRLFLKIKSIRVERLKDISEADAVYEGIEVIHFAEPSVPIFKRYDLKEKLGTVNPIFSFESLWQKINGRQSLINNPWVWVIEFERIEKPENF